MKTRIIVLPSCFIPEFIMEFNVPEDRDTEEFIDEYLDSILSDDLRFNCEWEFDRP